LVHIATLDEEVSLALQATRNRHHTSAMDAALLHNGNMDTPYCDELLVAARKLLLSDILPQLSATHKYRALMIANAMGIASREVAIAQHDARPMDNHHESNSNNDPSFVNDTPDLPMLIEQTLARVSVTKPKRIVEWLNGG